MLRGLLIGLVALGVAGCKDKKSLESEVPEGSRGDESVRQECVTEGAEVEATDVNNDDDPDIRHVLTDGRRKCSEIDLNYDGLADITRFYGPDGETPIREEHDFDFDGKLDQIAFFDNGELVRKELDTNFDNRIDTWMWCDGGQVEKAERDRRNTGDVDTWEVYEDGVLSQAAYDENNDGEPEKWELFEDGRLREIRYDTDYDGEADRKETLSPEESGRPDQALTCRIGDLGQRTAGGEEPTPADGDEGADGADGDEGAEGADGADGDEGADGADGDEGADGADSGDEPAPAPSPSAGDEGGTDAGDDEVSADETEGSDE
ncbi:MAG: hypothetical protein ACOCXM_05115 [Myxococcota bacterium]